MPMSMLDILAQLVLRQIAILNYINSF